VTPAGNSSYCDFIVNGIVTQLLRTLSKYLDCSNRKGAAGIKPEHPRTDQMQVPPAAIECVIRAQPDKDFLRLEAVVRSDTPVSGQYNFVIAKQSSTGSSNNTQSGTFALRDGPEQVLTTLILDRSAIGHYRAELSLQSDRGRFTCTSP
jgi:hypothetical protein